MFLSEKVFVLKIFVLVRTVPSRPNICKRFLQTILYQDLAPAFVRPPTNVILFSSVSILTLLLLYSFCGLVWYLGLSDNTRDVKKRRKMSAFGERFFVTNDGLEVFRCIFITILICHRFGGFGVFRNRRSAFTCFWYCKPVLIGADYSGMQVGVAVGVPCLVLFGL